MRLPPPPNEKELLAQLPLISAIRRQHAGTNPEKLRRLDENMAGSFDSIIRENGYPSERRWIVSMMRGAVPIVLKLKRQFSQLRPHELARKHRIDFDHNLVESASDTASYPSGHTAQAHYIAGRLMAKYPELRAPLAKVANDIELSRLIFGVHFPSDNKAGRLLAAKMLDQYRQTPRLPLGELAPSVLNGALNYIDDALMRVEDARRQLNSGGATAYGNLADSIRPPLNAAIAELSRSPDPAPAIAKTLEILNSAVTILQSLDAVGMGSMMAPIPPYAFTGGGPPTGAFSAGFPQGIRLPANPALGPVQSSARLSAMPIVSRLSAMLSAARSLVSSVL
jgi:hypothetical protein